MRKIIVHCVKRLDNMKLYGKNCKKLKKRKDRLRETMNKIVKIEMIKIVLLAAICILGLLVAYARAEECKEYVIDGDTVIECPSGVKIIGRTLSREEVGAMEERTAAQDLRWHEMVQGEIDHIRARKLESDRIEVLARLERMDAPRVNVEAIASNRNEVQVETKQEVTT